MAKFADTPDWKRGQWDPRAQRLVFPDKPATKKQRMYVAGLCRRKGIEVVRPRTHGEAQRLIEDLREAA